MGDGPQADLYAFLRSAWAQKRWFALLLFIPIAVFVLVMWNAAVKLGDRAGASLVGTIETLIGSFFGPRSEPEPLISRQVPSGSVPWLEVAFNPHSPDDALILATRAAIQI